MRLDEALAQLHEALEQHPTADEVPVPMDALCVVMDAVSGRAPVGFTDDEAALVAEFAGLPVGKVRGVETLTLMKVASR
jgi:hypothetical protein